MSSIVDSLSLHAIDLHYDYLGAERALALVQNGMVVSTFPGTQWQAALDLARVLSRALGQVVAVFRLPRSVAEGLHAGERVSTDEPAWTCMAQVRPSLLAGIEVEIWDSEMTTQITP
ncbi:MAG: hypothetical protein H0W78_00610 [Planctomycetes bacterium]|jgi:hypothetical protein|nr:hypothetical protein [Planctomycetota bacterium]